MDRQIVYPGSIPLDTDLLSIQRNTMVALGYLAQATLGTATVADGLACSPTQPATMSVMIGPGSLTQFGAVDQLPFGSLPALPNDQLVHVAVQLVSVSFVLAAPVAAGQYISYLIQASMLEQDATPVVLPYYNASNPTQPYSGPGNSGVSQVTQRLQTVQLQLKAGPSGATPSVPSVDAGWVGLYVVTVGFGQVTIGASSIVTLPTAPFITWKLPALSPGTSHLAVFQPTSQGLWAVPAGVNTVKVRVWGGGGAGGSGLGGAGAGGGGGGYSEGFYPVSAGQSFVISVGNGGAGAGSGGGSSSFGVLATGAGGHGGASGSPNSGGAGGAAGGAGGSTGLSVSGGLGGDPFGAGGVWLSGPGGGSYSGGGGAGAIGASGGSVAGRDAAGPGGGGSGGVGSGLGGQGGAGLVLVDW